MDPELTKDAVYNFRRAARMLVTTEGGDELDEITEDAVLQFAFGLERFCKAVLRNVNPAFAYEEPKFDNIAPLLYSGKMVNKHQQEAEKSAAKADLKNHVLALSKSVHRAKQFSNVVDNHIGQIFKIGGFRDIIVHRDRSELNHTEIRETLYRVFHPLVSEIAAEMKVDPTEIFEDNGTELKMRSDGVIGIDKLFAGYKAKREEHAKLWEKRKDDRLFIKRADNVLAKEINENPDKGPVNLELGCPVCGNFGVGYVDYYPEAFGGSSFIIHFECPYCDLVVDDPEEISLYKFNDDLD